jgi:hypothetical protein
MYLASKLIKRPIVHDKIRRRINSENGYFSVRKLSLLALERAKVRIHKPVFCVVLCGYGA